MKKILQTLFVLIIFFSPSKGQTLTDVFTIIDKLSGTLSEIEVFTSMDESLKTMKNIQDAGEAIKAPTEWYKKMKHIKRMIVLVESTTCAVQDLDFLYQNYLGNVWTDWDSDGGCMTGLKYEMILTKAEVVVDMVGDLVESNNLDPGQRDIIALESIKGLQEFTELATEFMNEMKAKIAIGERFEYQKNSFVTPSTVNTSKYDDATNVARNMLGNGSGLKGIANSIVSIILVLSIIPIVGQIDNPDAMKKGILMWVVALVIYIVFSNLFG